MDGNEYIEYGMGLRAVTLGHAYRAGGRGGPPAARSWAATSPPGRRSSWSAPSSCSAMVDGAEMVKFAKNGSDATTRPCGSRAAYTGRDMVALCGDHPFFSVDDWFIGTTPMDAGIPAGDPAS